MREVAARTVRRLKADPNVDVVPQTSLQFQSAAEYYAARSDKEWGLTDCASFILMKDRGLTEALATDRHFAQAGFAQLVDSAK